MDEAMYKKLLAENGGGDDGKTSIIDRFMILIYWQYNIELSFCYILSNCVFFIALYRQVRS
jgi:hypothetical protein